MAKQLTIKANNLSELELILKVHHNFDKDSEKYCIIEETSSKGLMKLFSNKIQYSVEITSLIEEKEVKSKKIIQKPKFEKPEVKKVAPKKQQAKADSIIAAKADVEVPVKKERKADYDSSVLVSEADIQDKLTKLLEASNLAIHIKSIEFKNDKYQVNLDGDEKGLMIGKKGKTLYSFEHIINQFFNLKYKKIFLNIEGFKEKRQETIQKLADSVAKKVIKLGAPVKLNYMPANERKYIHEIISNYPELESLSEGKNPKRYVVVKKRRKDSNV